MPTWQENKNGYVTISDDPGASSAHVDSDGTVKGTIKSRCSSISSRSSNKGNSGGGMPLFRWFRGVLELACLPHLMEKIDVIDENHGLLKSVVVNNHDSIVNHSSLKDEKEEKDHLAERQVSILSTLAWNDANYPIPNVERKWSSPDLMTFRSSCAAIEHSSMLLERDKTIDRVLYGIGKRGDLLRPAKPTRKLSLEAGYFRFLRDGIWVVGQEEEWIQHRMVDYNKEEEEKGDETMENDSIMDAPQDSTAVVVVVDDNVVDNDYFHDEKKEENESIIQGDTARKINSDKNSLFTPPEAATSKTHPMKSITIFHKIMCSASTRTTLASG